jgi:hypothetical protein
LSNKFDETIINYGYEDLVFMFDLGRKDILVKHIDNTTYHLGLETSQQYLDKTKIALKNLVTLQTENKIDTQSLKILRVSSFLKTIQATSIISKLFELFEKPILKNLTSNNPSLLVFDFFRIGYLCKLNKL